MRSNAHRRTIENAHIIEKVGRGVVNVVPLLLVRTRSGREPLA